MFDFAWSEMAIIAAVALVVIGPKDLPVALRAISGFVKKARRMAGEFQTHVDEMMRDADLKDVKDSLNQIRNFDFRSTVEKAIDPDHTLRDTFAGSPLDPTVDPRSPGEPTVSEPRSRGTRTGARARAAAARGGPAVCAARSGAVHRWIPPAPPSRRHLSFRRYPMLQRPPA